MSLSIGIVGLPNVGKSTLFNALTKKGVPAENYPFCTIDPSVGVVAVPDERLTALSTFSETKKIVPAIVEFVDIAGLVKGASSGEGLGNAFLSHIRETDAIAEVVRIYEDDKLIHVEGGVNPLRDIQIINMELILADMSTIEKRQSNIQKDVKKGDKNFIKLDGLIDRLKIIFNESKLANEIGDLDDEEKKHLRELHLITSKPILYVLNKKSGGKNLDEMNDDRYKELLKYFADNNLNYCVVDAKVEDELKDFEGSEKVEMREALTGSSEAKDDGINNLIKAGYNMLGLETFLTTGVEETRAWTIKKGSTAPIAGTAIHNDFKDKFIRAEVINWKELIDSGSFANARATGKLRTEGKDYIVKDGDVMEFKV
jgi:GTP-binding protein YchF